MCRRQEEEHTILDQILSRGPEASRQHERARGIRLWQVQEVLAAEPNHRLKINDSAFRSSMRNHI